jgi:hypothetical protein
MAYTFSHPAAILPLRKYFPFSALIVGSMAPDFLYFIPRIRHHHYGHSTEGIFTFCIPASLIVLWLFHAVMKRPLLRMAPYREQQKLVRYTTPFSFGGIQKFLSILLAIFAGAEAHVWWDGFTHQFGYFSKHFPVLVTPVTKDGMVLVCDVLQYGTSLVGALVLLEAYWRWSRQASLDEVPHYYRISGTVKFAIAVIIASLSVVLAILHPTPIPPAQWTPYHVAVIEALDVTRALLGLTLLLCIAWFPRSRKALSHHAVET